MFNGFWCINFFFNRWMLTAWLMLGYLVDTSQEFNTCLIMGELLMLLTRFHPLCFIFFNFLFRWKRGDGKRSIKYWIIFLQKSNHFSKRYARLHSKQEMLHNVSAYAEHLFKVIDKRILRTLILHYNAIFYVLITSNPLKRLVMIFFFLFSEVPGFN